MTTLHLGSMQVWCSVLDDLAAALDEQEAALAGNRAPTTAPFRPPAVMPPLPPALLARAQGLARRNDALLARARAMTAELPSPVRGGQRRTGATAMRRSAFDQRG